MQEQGNSDSGYKNRFLRASDVKRILQLSSTTLWRRMSSGEIPYIKKHRIVYFEYNDIINYVRKNEKNNEDEFDTSTLP